MQRKSGFTLIELLVVIAIIALLLSIIVPAMNIVKERTMRLLCSNNLHQCGLGMHAYATENKNKLPLLNQGNWLWDMAYSTTHNILATARRADPGASANIFYCPAERVKNAQDPRFWLFTQINSGNYTPGDPMPEESTTPGSFRVTGYFWMVDTEQPRTTPPTTIEGESPVKRWIRTLGEKQPASTEVAVDATLSNVNDRDPDAGVGGGNFVTIKGGLWTEWQIYDKTNHVNKGKPLGTNVLFLDNHATWRDFKDMFMRFKEPISPYQWW